MHNIYYTSFNNFVSNNKNLETGSPRHVIEGIPSPPSLQVMPYHAIGIILVIGPIPDSQMLYCILPQPELS